LQPAQPLSQRRILLIVRIVQRLLPFLLVQPLLHAPASNWKKAMDDEFDALIKNKTWELVPRPPDANVIRSLWIFAHKEKSDGSFERHKSRLVGDIILTASSCQ